MNLRELILDILLEWEQGQVFSHVLLQNVLNKYDYLEGRDKAFIKRVTQGTIERKIQIDYILNLFSNVPTHKMKKVIRNILRSSVYQILYMDSIPDSAVCNEAVKLANKRKFSSLKGYVNGVLRQIVRQKDSITWPDFQKEPETYYSVNYSMPEFLVRHFCSCYGTEAEQMMEAFLRPSPVTIRFAPWLTQMQMEEYEKKWKDSGVVVEPHTYDCYARKLEKAEGVANLAGFAEGDFVVQDISSMMVCRCANLQEGMQVVDVCAAPGGKAIHAAQLVGTTGHVRTFDVSYAKVSKIVENMERVGIENMDAEEADATVFRKDLVESADVLIADVPCSGLGVIGKKQDIKYRVDETALRDIVALQKQILKNVASYVKVGGAMMYSTCTLNPEENEQMVDWIERELPFVREDIRAELPEPLQNSVQKGCLQLKPGVHESDGFFIARLRRKEIP